MDRGDADLVKDVLDGRIQAFGALVDRYQGVVFNLAYRMMRDYDGAQDITQVAFIKAYEHLDRFDPRFEFLNWIYRIAANEALNRIKSNKRMVSLNPGLKARVKNPEETYGETETGEKIQDALMDLVPFYRTLIILRHFRDCSYREIGDILDISEQKVKSRLFKARRLMRDALISRGVLGDE